VTRIVIDVERCTGHGRCYDLTPELFEADDRGHGRVIAGVTDIDERKARAAAQACPEQAIRIDP
jgi:ferredoxin